MKEFKVSVKISLKPELFDPEGKTIERAIKRIGFSVKNTRVSKVVEFVVEAESQEEAKDIADQISSKILANPVLHTYLITVEEL